MGWGKALSAVVVMSISVMLVVSVLPVGADHQEAHKGTCNGPWTSITITEAITHPDMENPVSVDKNDNGWVCWKMKGNEKYHFKDDNPIKYR